MKTKIFIVLTLFSSVVFAQSTRARLTTKINDSITTNGSRGITGAILNNVLLDLNTSLLNKTSDGYVTTVTVTPNAGVSGTVATYSTTPNITITLGAITPSSVNGNVITTGTGSLTVTSTATVTGNNTGDQVLIGTSPISASTNTISITKASSSVNGYLDTVDFQAFSQTAPTAPIFFTEGATTAALPSCTYSSNTITATANGAFPTIDGVTYSLADLILVKNQAAQLQNGIDSIIDLGSAGTPFILVRPYGYNESAELYPSQVNVLNGTVNGGKYYLQTTATPTVGVSSIVYSSIAVPGSLNFPVKFVKVHTETALTYTPTYTSGTDVTYPAYLATYTATANGAFPTLQGVAPYVNMSVMVKDQADSTKNGDYTLIKVGSASSKYKLRRISHNVSQLYPHIWEVSEGTDKGKLYQQDTKTLVNSTIGTSGNIVFTEISPSTTLVAGSNIALTGSSTYTVATTTTPTFSLVTTNSLTVSSVATIPTLSVTNTITTPTLTVSGVATIPTLSVTTSGIATYTLATSDSTTSIPTTAWIKRRLAAIPSLFTDGGAFAYLTTTTDALQVGSSSDLGAALGVKGFGATSGTFAGKWTNSAAVALFTIRNDGCVWSKGRNAVSANTAYGEDCLQGAVTGNYNTAYGKEACFSNTGGAENTAVGRDVLYYNTNGTGNTGMGQSALASCTNDNNTAVGRSSGGAISSGSDNSAFGKGSMLAVTTGIQNVAIGSNSMSGGAVGNSYNVAVGTNTLFSATGSYNTALGYQSLYGATVTNSNTAVGAFAGYNSVANGVFLGYYAGKYETASNKLYIDAIDRTSEALGRTNSLIYGVTHATPTSQTLTFNAKVNINGKFLIQQGTDVASVAGAIALALDGNVFEITGTNAITLISNVGWQNGAEVTLLFTSTATLTNGTATSGTDIIIKLAGAANFVATADDSITLTLSEIGGVQAWREKCRSVN